MVDSIIESEGLKDPLLKELRGLGVCDLCTLRYLGVKDPAMYKIEEAKQKILRGTDYKIDVAEEEPLKKIAKASPCPACLGLLEHGIEESSLQEIADEIIKAGIESSSYAPMLTLPISISVRAYSIWHHLVEKFPRLKDSDLSYLRPEGMALKSVWKWIVTSELRQRVDPKAEWMTCGDLTINVFLKYEEESAECLPLLKFMRLQNKRAELSRVSTDQALFIMDAATFRKHFPSPPITPTFSLKLEKIVCTHNPIFIAGRYCKYSRDVSQSPWLNFDGSRVRGEGSVQEYISEHVYPIFNCETIRFSASGREDADVRMLGSGRPFVIELINPRKTLFTPMRIKMLQNTINQSTKLISVRDFQIVDKRDLAKLKAGEETKNKVYTALCKTTGGRELTTGMLDILNRTTMPLVLKQITPLRVLHRRSLLTRERKILEMSAVPAKRSKEMFILTVKTEAGTYVKEFVHGDCGRTQPCIGDLLGFHTDILSLDVSDVELDWPPKIEDDNNTDIPLKF